MEIIAITIDVREGQPRLSYTASSGVSPALGESACRAIADAFREAAIEAEVARRVAAQNEGES